MRQQKKAYRQIKENETNLKNQFQTRISHNQFAENLELFKFGIFRHQFCDISHVKNGNR